VIDFVEGKQTLLRLKTSYGSSNTIAENLQPPSTSAVPRLLAYFRTLIKFFN